MNLATISAKLETMGYAAATHTNYTVFTLKGRRVSSINGVFIGGCKNCKRPLRSEGAVDFATGSNYHSACPCGAWVTVAPLRGRVTEHKCGAKCRASKGPTCDCSCGGANHGCG